MKIHLFVNVSRISLVIKNSMVINLLLA